MSEFPTDEFDEAIGRRGPVGVHRRKPSMVWRIITPFIVLILACALAYGVAVYSWQRSGGTGLPPTGEIAVPTITQTVIDTPSSDSNASSSDTASATTSVAPEPTETAAAVDFTANVAVLNGAGVSGLAGRNETKLADAGFTNTEAGNLTDGKPAANVVRYADADLAATAQQVAAALGIGAVEQGTVPQGDIAVLLVSDNGV